MRVAVAGSSGLIGTALVSRLRGSGHEVVRLVRRSAQSPHEVRWEPSEGLLDASALGEVDAIVNLAGAGVGDQRWTDEYKETLVDSRIDTTNTLVEACTALPRPPAVLVNASAQGFYGDRGDEILTEESTAGEGFLAELCLKWEAAAQRAAEVTDGATRVTLIRTGMVMSPDGGAFGKMMPLLKFGLAGPLGDGKQWWAWITLDDHVAAIEHLLTADVHGPVNLCAPNPVRQGELMDVLGKQFKRPTFLPAPAFALKLVLGEFSQDVLSSCRMDPDVLERSGFTFTQQHADEAAEWLKQRS